VIKNTDEKTAFNILKEASKSSIASLSKKYNKKVKVIEATESNVTKEEAQKLGLDWKKGAVNAMEKNLGINAYIFSKIEGFIAAAPKDLKDTRGYVVADFQDSLEKSWIESLRKKYPVKINENILNNIYK
jgi:peptidyl-prolyl cis-trans isomerase SurA